MPSVSCQPEKHCLAPFPRRAICTAEFSLSPASPVVKLQDPIQTYSVLDAESVKRLNRSSQVRAEGVSETVLFRFATD